MIVYGNKKTQLLGTAQDDTFYPSGNVPQELTLSPGNDTYSLGDYLTSYDFYLTPVNYYTSTGARINLGASTVTLGEVSLKPNTISDGYGGIDTILYSQDKNNYWFRIYSGPYDDYLNTTGGNFWFEWRISPGAGNDTITANKGSIFVTGAASLNVNFNGLSGRLQFDPITSLTYSFNDSMYWEFVGPSGSNKIVNTSPNTFINFHLYSGVTIGEQSIVSSGNDIGINFANYTNANINIAGKSGVIQVDPKTSLTYKVDQGQGIYWNFQAGTYKVNGSLENERFTFDWGNSTTIAGGGGADTFYINRNMVSSQINDYNFEDKLVFNILETNDKATLAKSVTITQNKANYTTTLAFAASSVSTAANLVVNGWYSNYQFNSDGTVQLIPLLPNDPKNASLFYGNYLNTTSGGAANNTILYLNNVQELLSFPIQSVTTPDQVYYFDTGYDLVHLWRTDNVLGGAASYRLIPTNFRSVSGAGVPTTPTEYVIYDTSTGNLYFDQDGTGPSPTVLAATFVDKPALKYTDFNTSVPQTYALSAGQDKVNRGQSATFTLSTTNVPSGTAVPYTLTGVAAADVTGGQLSGTALVDSSGKATISVLLAASGSQGAKTLSISAGGQSASVSVADTVSTPTYALTASSSSVNEGTTATFTLTTTNLSVGTSVAYTLSGTGITASDIVGGQLTGTVTIGANGQTTIPIALTADQITEGAETLKITVGSAVGSILINDTSTTPSSSYIYYAKPNEVVDAAKLPNNITTIQGAGGNTITLSTKAFTYYSGPGQNSIFGSDYYQICFGDQSNVEANLQTGVIKSNGAGGSDTVSGNLYSIWTSPTSKYSANIVGNSLSNQFFLWSDNNTIDGGAGVDLVLLWGKESKDYAYSFPAKNAILVTNKSTGQTDYLTNVESVNFRDIYYDFSDVINIKSYKLGAINSYYFAGSTITIPVISTNVSNGTSIRFQLFNNDPSPLINNNSSSGSATVSNNQAVFLIPTSASLTTGSLQYQFRYIADQGWMDQFNYYINLIPAAKITASTPQVNTGAVETFTISTQLPAGEKFDYTLSGVGQGDVPTVPLTGTLTADANGSATLTVPLASRSSFAGNQTMTLTAGGTASSVAIVDNGNKTPQIYYAQPNEIVDGNKLASNYGWIKGSGNNQVNLASNNSYMAGPGNNQISAVSGQYAFYELPSGSSGSINLATGIVSNNGYGGVDRISGIASVGVGGSGSNFIVVGNEKNNVFFLSGGVSTIDGGGGVDLAYINFIDNGSISYSPNGNEIIVTNSQSGQIDKLSNVEYVVFLEKLIDFTEFSKPKTFYNPSLEKYYFSGTSITVSINTKNVSSGTQVSWFFQGNEDTATINNGSNSGNLLFGGADIATFNLSIPSNIQAAKTINLQFGINNYGYFQKQNYFTILPAAKLTPSASQINTGSVETFTISTQLPVGEKLDYTLSGITTSDTTLSSLTGTLTADANGAAKLIVPLLARSNYQGDKTLTLTAGGSTSTVTVVDTFAKQAGWSYGTGGDDNIDGSKLPTSTKYVNSGAGNDVIYLTGNQYYETNYGNKTVYGLSSNAGMFFWSAVQPVNVNLATGVVSNNGFGGQDKVSGITNVMTGSTDTTIVGSSRNEQFTVNGANSTITGGGGTDSVLYYPNNSPQFQISLRPDKGVNVVDTKTNTLSILYGITNLVFADKTILTSSIFGLSANSTSVNEGSTATFTLTTAGLASGTPVTYTLSGAGITSSDIGGGLLSGTATVDSTGKATISIPIAADQTTEGPETLTVTVQNSSATIVINDTSTSPFPTYLLTANSPSVNEGGSAVFGLVTSNVAPGTSVPYTLTGGGITSGDISGGQLSGSVVVDASGRATISIPIASDGIAEGSETLLVSAGGKTASILINDAGIAKTGTTGPDSLVGSVGSDTLDGGGGVDTVFYSSNQSAYTLTRGAAWTLSSSADGLDSLVNVERLHFADQSLALDVGVNQPSGQAAVLLGAVLPGKLALDPGKQALMGTVIGLFDMGYSLTDLAGALLRLDIWTILTGSNSNQARASYLLSNVNGVAPDATTLANGVNALNTEPVQGTWLAALAGGSAGQSHIGLSTLAQTGLAYIAPESITSSGQSINEGDTVSFTVTTNLPQGTSLPYTLSGTGVSSADITGAMLSGTVTVNAYGQANVSVGVVADSLTEGAETLVFTSRGISASAVINDTSIAIVPTYLLTAGSVSVNEGGTAIFTVTTTNVPFGTNLSYTLSGAGITPSDIVGGQLSGNISINSGGVATIFVSLAADLTTEGPETLTVTVAGKTAQIAVNDTSMAAATYQILPSALAVNGGDTLIVTLKTTNLAAGTHVPFTLNVPVLDIVGGALNGEFILDANGSASVNIATTQHQTTDTMIINVFDQHQSVTLVGVKGG